MNGIDIRLLPAAIAVAEELSFSRAAARLHITQPALSKQIHDLESHLGVPLFDRDNQGVELTDPAELSSRKLGFRCFTLKEQFTRLVQFLVDASIGSIALFPKIRIYRSSNFSPELSRQVLTAELEIALFTAVPRTPRLNFQDIASATFYAVLRESDQIAKKRETRLDDCHERPWFLFGRHLNPSLYEAFMAQAREEDVSPTEVHHVTTAEKAAHFLAHQDGIAFLTQHGAWRIARNGLAMRPLVDDELRLRTVLVTRADDQTRLVSEFVRATVPKLQNDRGVKQQQLALAG